MTRFIFLVLCLFFIVKGSVLGAEYQWSTPVDAVISKETGGHPRAFLWIPGDCKQVRAILIAPGPDCGVGAGADSSAGVACLRARISQQYTAFVIMQLLEHCQYRFWLP